MKTYTIDELKKEPLAVLITSENNIKELSKLLSLPNEKEKTLIFRFKTLKEYGYIRICFAFCTGTAQIAPYELITRFRCELLNLSQISKTQNKAPNKAIEQAETSNEQTPPPTPTNAIAGQRWATIKTIAKDLLNLINSIDTAEELAALRGEITEFVAARKVGK